MTAAAARAGPDPLDGWRRWRASRGEEPAAAVASVASVPELLATPARPRETSIVASVASAKGEGGDTPVASLGLAIGDADLWLTKRAVELAHLAEGGEVRPCPVGGLDVIGADGRAGWFAAGLLAELRAAGLLHPAALAALRGGQG